MSAATTSNTANQEVYRTVFIGLGSNIAPDENIPRALELLKQAVSINALSTAWETPAVGSDGPDFINMVVSVSTPLTAEALKNEVLRNIENQLGRLRTADKHAPRPIDLDILIYDGLTVDPQIWEYPHWAIPLAELIPEYRHDKYDITLGDVARKLKQRSGCHLQPHPIV